MFYVRFDERYIYYTWQSYTIVIQEMRPYGVRFLTDALNPPIHLIGWTLINLIQIIPRSDVPTVWLGSLQASLTKVLPFSQASRVTLPEFLGIASCYALSRGLPCRILFHQRPTRIHGILGLGSNSMSQNIRKIARSTVITPRSSRNNPRRL
jgi:hypothetical protein